MESTRHKNEVLSRESHHEQGQMQNILFYEFAKLDPVIYQDRLLEICHSLQLKGTILLAEEGINGCLSGVEASTILFMDYLKGCEPFKNIVFKITPAEGHTFKKLKIQVKPEIIKLGTKVDLSQRGGYVEPDELKELLDTGKAVMVDMRNRYEADVGKFKDAIIAPIDVFNELPHKLAELDAIKKAQEAGKVIVTYCTGGIRCEKATALLNANGFEVKQLHGGIIEYGKVHGNAHWEGQCFVFDSRVALDLDPERPNEPKLKKLLRHALQKDEFDFLRHAVHTYESYVAQQEDEELLSLFTAAKKAVMMKGYAKGSTSSEKNMMCSL